jgi:nucleoside-diphosphate-sugar epimerase
MTLSRSVVSTRAAQVQAALARADKNRDGRLSAAEQRVATGLVKGSADAALRESYQQARMGSGYVSVSKARGLVNLAQEQLGWQPTVALDLGLDSTIAYFKEAITA